MDEVDDPIHPIIVEVPCRDQLDGNRAPSRDAPYAGAAPLDPPVLGQTGRRAARHERREIRIQGRPRGDVGEQRPEDERPGRRRVVERQRLRPQPGKAEPVPARDRPALAEPAEDPPVGVGLQLLTDDGQRLLRRPPDPRRPSAPPCPCDRVERSGFHRLRPATPHPWRRSATPRFPPHDLPVRRPAGRRLAAPLTARPILPTRPRATRPTGPPIVARGPARRPTDPDESAPCRGAVPGRPRLRVAQPPYRGAVP